MARSNEVAFKDAFLLRRKPYRETSVLVQFWVRDIGLVDAVIKGVHGSDKASHLKNAWLQPFQCLSIQLRGQSALKQVYKYEPVPPMIRLQPQLLLTGQYVNEIVVISLLKHESESSLFDAYHDFLQRLSHLGAAWPESDDQYFCRVLAIQLRTFEQQLLESIGFSIDWLHDVCGHHIQPEARYRFIPGEGFVQQMPSSDHDKRSVSDGIFNGVVLLAIGCSAWDIAGALGVGRRVLRQQIEYYAGQNLRAPSLQGSGLEPRTAAFDSSSLE